MPDTKITALTALTAADPANDVLPIVDVSDTTMAASGTTKKISINNVLGASGTATLASATITGNLTVDTNTLFVDSANNRVIVGHTSGSSAFQVSNAGAAGFEVQPTGVNSAPALLSYNRSSAAWMQMTYIALNHVWQNSGSTAMTLDATGLGVGVSPTEKLSVNGNASFSGFGINAAPLNPVSTSQRQARFQNTGGDFYIGIEGSVGGAFFSGSTAYAACLYNAANTPLQLFTNGTLRATIDTSGNVGIGVTPSLWDAGLSPIELKSGSVVGFAGSVANYTSNAFYQAAWKYKTTAAAAYYQQANGSHVWNTAPSGTAGTAITWTQAMTLDASGNLLVGITSGSYNRIKKDVTADAGNAIFELVGASNATSSIHYSVSSYNANAANAASKFGRDGVTLRSINAGGTVNASGADYAEYMTKASDFVLSKGGIAGIDANGKLTNVFADAVSFVVKSTDPSYVGNDKWGNDLEGDELEAARQLVDRIAFAGQVPVNVTGAKAGDYIVPVVDGTGIKGIAVSKPTFEQYQLAVGKVIAIDADGRARIIVKVA